MSAAAVAAAAGAAVTGGTVVGAVGGTLVSAAAEKEERVWRPGSRHMARFLRKERTACRTWAGGMLWALPPMPPQAAHMKQ